MKKVNDLVPKEMTFKLNVTIADMPVIRMMQNVCLCITDEQFMRGTDFRVSTEEEPKSETDGIDLLIAQSFSNYRAFDQGRARVGRY